MGAPIERSTTSKKLSRLARVVAGIAVLGALVFFFVVPDFVARTLNRVNATNEPTISPRALTLYEHTIPVDLHADTFLWNRDPAKRGDYGHVDLPRLIQSRMGLQVFSTVTKSPRGLNFERNDATTDNITPLVVAQRWPPRTWTSLKARAQYQAERLQAVAENSDGTLQLIHSVADLHAYLDARRKGDAVAAGLLAIEGLHALDQDIGNVRALYDTGFRMMGLTHFFDNAIGGSAHGIKKHGITDFGRAVVREMIDRKIVIDLAHASEALFDDVIREFEVPVVVSHTGVKGTCDRRRNLSDKQLRAVAAVGGLIGIAYFPEAICGRSVSAVAAAIRHTADVIGVEHVTLGSDFDGAVVTPIDVGGLPQIVQSLINSGFSDDEIHAIMGGNALRFLESNLPAH